jgi:hypothetical protein
MHSEQDDTEEFRRLLARGSIQRAHRALLSYMMRLRTHFENNLSRLPEAYSNSAPLVNVRSKSRSWTELIFAYPRRQLHPAARYVR